MDDYSSDLSAVAKKCYLSKLTTFGFLKDPYSIPDSSWITGTDILSQVTWSDMSIYLTSTPSPYTQQELKVHGSNCMSNSHHVANHTSLEGHDWL